MNEKNDGKLQPRISDCFLYRNELEHAIIILDTHKSANCIELSTYLVTYVKKAIQKRIRNLINSIIAPEKVQNETNEVPPSGSAAIENPSDQPGEGSAPGEEIGNGSL